MSVLVPTPLYLVAQWPLTEPAGATEHAQIIPGTGGVNGFADVTPMSIYRGTSEAGYPAPIDGPVAGSVAQRYGTAALGTSDGLPVEPSFAQSYRCDGNTSGPGCWGQAIYTIPQDHAISIWFRRHSAVQGPIFGIASQYDSCAGSYYPQPFAGGGKPNVGFYIGLSNQIHFAWQGVVISTWRTASIPSSQTYLDGLWHQAVGIIQYDDVNAQLLGDPTFRHRKMSFYIDGELLGTWTLASTNTGETNSMWTACELGNPSIRAWFLGSGYVNSAYGAIFPDANSRTANGGCGCDLYDARVYCGTMTPELIPPPYVAPPDYEYIGHCPNVNDGNICLTRSNSRCRTGGSSSAVIVTTGAQAS